MNKQALIKKYAKKFVCTGKYAPNALKGVYYAADGSVVMTNRHYLLRIKGAHQLQTPVILDPKDGQPIEGTYPEIKHVLDATYKDVVRLTMKSVTAAKAAAAVAGGIEGAMGNAVSVSIENGVAKLRVHDNLINFEALFGNADRADVAERILLNAQYLYTTLSLFADAGVGQVQLQYKGAEDQIQLTDESEEITVIILPIRRWG